MNSKELMIGDWAIFNGNPLKVQAIDSRDSEIVAEDGIFCTEESRWAYTADKVEGIPLTPEILEKNGWWFDTEDTWRHDEVNFTIEKWNGRYQCYNINQIKLYSVHQLQQALRLAGMVDMANNFKI